MVSWNFLSNKYFVYLKYINTQSVQQIISSIYKFARGIKSRGISEGVIQWRHSKYLKYLISKYNNNNNKIF